MQDSVTTWVITVLSMWMVRRRRRRGVARSGHGGAANDSKALYFKVIRYFSQIALIYNMYKQIHLIGAAGGVGASAAWHWRRAAATGIMSATFNLSRKAAWPTSTSFKTISCPRNR